jgi:hypothetical protein
VSVDFRRFVPLNRRATKGEQTGCRRTAERSVPADTTVPEPRSPTTVPASVTLLMGAVRVPEKEELSIPCAASLSREPIELPAVLSSVPARALQHDPLALKEPSGVYRSARRDSPTFPPGSAAQSPTGWTTSPPAEQ